MKRKDRASKRRGFSLFFSRSKKSISGRIFTGGKKIMIFHQYPEWTAAIRNHYWHLRYRRGYDEARRRKEYRRIEAEKNAFKVKASILS
jgi:hypothetical protein